jgi:predicted secreted protein
MALDNAKNFAKVTVSTGYDASATSIVLTTGHGVKLPTAPFNVTWWNATDYADPSDDPNVEIVRVTAKATDTLTVTRNQESSGASTKNTAGKTYKMIAGLTVKATTDLAAASTLAKNLCAHFPLDFAGISSTVIYDGSLIDNNGSISGATFSPTGGPDSNGSFAFNGTTDYLEVPHNVNQLLVNGFTISAWIKPTTTGEGGVGAILTKTTDINGTGGWRYALTGTSQVSMKINNGTTIATSNNAYVINDGNWYHVVVTVASDATVTHYVNGVANGTPAASGALSGITTTNVMRIGNRSTATDQTFDGSITKVRLYARVLSAAEIIELYTNKL